MAKLEPKLIPAPETALEVPQFPITNIQIVPQGVLVAMILANNISINCLIGEDAMHDLCRQFLEFRKAQADQLRVIREVNKSKIN